MNNTEKIVKTTDWSALKDVPLKEGERKVLELTDDQRNELNDFLSAYFGRSEDDD